MWSAVGLLAIRENDTWYCPSCFGSLFKKSTYSRVNKWNSLIFIKPYLRLKQLPNMEPWYYFLYFCLSTTITIIAFQCNFIPKWNIRGLAALQWVCYYQSGKTSGTNTTCEWQKIPYDWFTNCNIHMKNNLSK